MQKTGKHLERYFKGVANHRRIDILFTVAVHEGITVTSISEFLRCNVKTLSEHTRRLVQAGLIEKRYQGLEVAHYLTETGKIFLRFLKSV